MCGVAGFSLSINSKINARALAHHLLTQIESRGQMASGFAYGYEGKVGYYKDAVAGSNLRLKGLPRDTKTVIAHTRYATHGAVTDNRNNHPVLSPDSKIALVHNGVIWNHDEVRHDSLSEFGLPDVDTSVIPAVLQKFGIDGVSKLSGDAAIAWLESDEPNVLHLARLESSPMSFTQLVDGSIVFASLPGLLENALYTMGLEFGHIMTMDERDYFQIEFGAIVGIDKSPEMKSFDTARWWQDNTAGRPSSHSKPPKGGSYAWEEDYDDKYDYATWRHDSDNFTGLPIASNSALAGTAMAFMNDDDMPDPTEFKGADPTDDMYYTIDHNGDFKSYRTLEGLESDLKWHAGVANDHGDPQFGGEGNARWMEYFLDLGSFGFGDDDLISWTDEPGEIAYHEIQANPRKITDLGYIRDGIALLKKIG
jgi:hypothetical protein